MFTSIKEKLILIKNNDTNPTHSLIAEYLLNCLDNGQTPKSKTCAEYAFTSESVITAFAKKYGYDGFKELAVRVKVEAEYYDFSKIHRQGEGMIKNEYKQIINQSFELIDAQSEAIGLLIQKIKQAKKIVALSCYQQYFNTELFISELQLLGYNAQINYQRKSNPGLLENLGTDDVVIIVAFGLDNQYLVNFYNQIKTTQKNIFIICSRSQAHKFDKCLCQIKVEYSERASILDSTRAVLIMYLFSQIIYNL